MGATASITGRHWISSPASDWSVCRRLYCAAAKLVIEIDGQIHDFTVPHDERRDEYIRALGLSILRIPASDVMADAFSVADGLVRLCGPSTAQLR